MRFIWILITILIITMFYITSQLHRIETASKQVHYLLPKSRDCAIKRMYLNINGEVKPFDRMVCHWSLN